MINKLFTKVGVIAACASASVHAGSYTLSVDDPNGWTVFNQGTTPVPPAGCYGDSWMELDLSSWNAGDTITLTWPDFDGPVGGWTNSIYPSYHFGAFPDLAGGIGANSSGSNVSFGGQSTTGTAGYSTPGDYTMGVEYTLLSYGAASSSIQMDFFLIDQATTTTILNSKDGQAGTGSALVGTYTGDLQGERLFFNTDDHHYCNVPEPSSALFLGLGGLVFLRRRR